MPVRSRRARAAAAAPQRRGRRRARREPADQAASAPQQARRRRRRARRRTAAGPSSVEPVAARRRKTRSPAERPRRRAASIAARTFASRPIARKSPTNAVASVAVHADRRRPAWRCDCELARAARGSCAQPRGRPTFSRISEVARRPLGQQRERGLVAEPGPHLRSSSSAPAPARRARRAPVAQPAAAPGASDDLRRRRATGSESAVDLARARRAARSAGTSAAACRRARCSSSCDQRGAASNAADQHDREREPVEGEARSAARSSRRLRARRALGAGRRARVPRALAVGEVDHQRHALEPVALAQPVLDEVARSRARSACGR